MYKYTSDDYIEFVRENFGNNSQLIINEYFIKFMKKNNLSAWDEIYYESFIEYLIDTELSMGGLNTMLKKYYIKYLSSGKTYNEGPFSKKEALVRKKHLSRFIYILKCKITDNVMENVNVD